MGTYASFTLVRLRSRFHTMKPVRRPSLHHFGFILHANWKANMDRWLGFVFVLLLSGCRAVFRSWGHLTAVSASYLIR